MNKIKLLDCTLRDGGYVVDTVFGDYSIRGITQKLVNTGIDIIELGYIKNCERKEGSTTYGNFEDLCKYIPNEKPDDVQLAVMIEYNTFDINKILSSDVTGIDIIRICFFKKDRFDVKDYAKEFINYGYKVYLQPMDTLGYSDIELLELVNIANELLPEALYIVDSYGAMYEDDLARIYSLMNHNLNDSIYIGLHSHNNLQLSFTLTQNLINLARNKRNIIIDGSACGIGRGAGNANTELIVNYLNSKLGFKYDLNELLDLLDRYITPISKEKNWGYSVPYFISGMYNIHVNNIHYLLKKHNIKGKDLNKIVNKIDKNSEKRYDYDKLEKIFIEYFNNEIDEDNTLCILKNTLAGKDVLLLAPGASISKEYEKIQEFINKVHPVTIAINSVLKNFNTDYIFYSNILRYEYSLEKYLNKVKTAKIILTSNIQVESKNNENIVNYNSLIKTGWKYFDNSTIMCLRLLINLGIKNIHIAGFDGYSIDGKENYADKDILINLTIEDKKLLNKELTEMMNDIIKSNSDLNISFLTPSLYSGLCNNPKIHMDIERERECV